MLWGVAGCVAVRLRESEENGKVSDKTLGKIDKLLTGRSRVVRGHLGGEQEHIRGGKIATEERSPEFFCR